MELHARIYGTIWKNSYQPDLTVEEHPTKASSSAIPSFLKNNFHLPLNRDCSLTGLSASKACHLGLEMKTRILSKQSSS